MVQFCHYLWNNFPNTWSVWHNDWNFFALQKLAIAYLVTTILASILALLLLFPIVFGILISLTSHRRPYFDYRKQYYWCEGLAIGEKLIPLKNRTKILKSFHFAFSLFQQCIP